MKKIEFYEDAFIISRAQSRLYAALNMVEF